MAATVLAASPHFLEAGFLEQWDTLRPPRPFHLSCWCPPPPGWLKVNVDGALLESNLAGVGLIFRDWRGTLLKAAGKSMEHWDSTRVELEAILFLQSNIELWMLEMQGVIVEGDNKGVLDLVSSSLKMKPGGGAFLELSEVAFLQQFPMVIFSHIYREGNKAADFCASSALGGDFVWSDESSCPPTLLSVVKEDRDHLPPS